MPPPLLHTGKNQRQAAAEGDTVSFTRARLSIRSNKLDFVTVPQTRSRIYAQFSPNPHDSRPLVGGYQGGGRFWRGEFVIPTTIRFTL